MTTTFKAAWKTGATASGAVIADIKAGAQDRVFIEKIEMFQTSGTASSVGLARPNVAGSGTATTVATPAAADPADGTANATIVTLGTESTIGTYLERWDLPAVQGAGIIAEFEDDDMPVVALSGILLLTNPGAAANGAVDLSVSWKE